LEKEARLSARVNCLLSGATVILSDRAGLATGTEGDMVTPLQPKDGYEHVTQDGDGQRCPTSATACAVANRRDWKVTWATCGTQKLQGRPLRGGAGMTSADTLKGTVVVTGNLSNSTNEFSPPQGLDGPDHFYTFLLSEKTNIEVAVGANTSNWLSATGHQSPWQPGLYLLRADGKKLSQGHVWRAGVTYLFPLELDKGTYYLVVDSSPGELSRGDGLYHLYLGPNKNHMGSTRSQ